MCQFHMYEQTISSKAVACIYAWCAQLRSGILLNSAFTFVWKFFFNTIASPTCNSEVSFWAFYCKIDHFYFIFYIFSLLTICYNIPLTVMIASNQSEAEVCIAAYEALAPALKAFVSAFSPQTLGLFRENCKSLLPAIEGKPWLDSLVLSFLQNINDLLAVGFMARTRRAVLLNWKVMLIC